MKKLMIAAAVAVLGIAANAASFAWKSTANMTDKDGNVLTSMSPAGTIALVYLGDDAAKIDWSKAAVVQEATPTFATSMGKPSALLTSKFSFDMADYGNGDIFGVMFKDAEGNMSYLKDQASGNDIMATYTITGLADDTSNLNAFSYTTSTYYAESVPEPTSGLLLLLGVAGLALKRRRA